MENPALIERPPWPGIGRLNVLREARAVWGGLRRADAAAYIVRGSGGHVIVAAAFCAAHRRPLVFSTSNDLDFDFERDDRRPFVLRVYRRAISLARRMVVQTEQQRELARAGGFDPAVIPSFAEPAERATAQPRHFLWANRLVEYKMPLEFLQLAEALPEARFLMIAGRDQRDHARAVCVACMRRRTGSPTSSSIPRAPASSCTRRWRSRRPWSRPRASRGCRTCSSRPGPAECPCCPCTSTPTGGSPTEASASTPAGSMERLIEGARSLWTDPSLRAEIGERARAFVIGHHGPAAVGDRWEALIREVVAPPA